MGPIYSILKKKEEAKNDEPVVATVPKPPSGIKKPSFKPRRRRNLTQRKGLLSMPLLREENSLVRVVSPRPQQPARRTRRKLGTVSPSIPTEEDEVVSPRKGTRRKSGTDSPSIPTEEDEVVSPRKGKKRAPVKNAAQEPSRRTRTKAGTVSPSIPTEEDSTPLQEECNAVVSPKKPRRKSHPRDAQFRQLFNRDFGQFQKILSRMGLEVVPKARAKPRPKSGGKPVPKAVPKARANGASKGSARGAARAGAKEEPKVKTGTRATIRKRKHK